MAKEKVRNFREWKNIIESNGFDLVRQSGDHHIYKKNGKTIVLSMPPNRMVMRRIVKEHDLVIN